MKTFSEGQSASSYTGNQIPHSTSAISQSTMKGTASTKNGFGDYANYVQSYGQPAYGTMPSTGISLMAGGTTISPYQAMKMGQMPMPTVEIQQQPQQYSVPSMQSIQMPTSMQAMPNMQIFQPPPTRLGSSASTPRQYAAYSKGVAGQTVSWPPQQQYASVNAAAMSNYPIQGRTQVMSTYATNPGQGSFIVDYSAGLKILDEPTGGTNYVTQ